jgi:hypothetical protein
MLRKWISGTIGLAAAVALTLAGPGHEAQARHRRCCCNSNGYYNNGFASTGAMQAPAASAPQTYDGGAPAPAPQPDNAPGVNPNGQTYGTQYGPRGTVIEGGVGVPGAIQGPVPDGTGRAGTRANVNAPAAGAAVQGTNGAAVNGANARAKTGAGANANAPAAGTNVRGSTGAAANGTGAKAGAAGDTKVAPPAPESPALPSNPTDNK